MPDFEITLVDGPTVTVGADTRMEACLIATRHRFIRGVYGQDFEGESFYNMTIRDMEFRACNFTETRFTNTLVFRCSMKNSSFDRASFFQSHFDFVTLDGSRFHDAAFDTSIFTAVSLPTQGHTRTDRPFRGAVFRGTKFPMSLHRMVSFQEAGHQHNSLVRKIKGRGFIAEVPRSDGYTFQLIDFGNRDFRVAAGCRFFTFNEARKHWQNTRGETSLGRETFSILHHFENIAIESKNWRIHHA